MGNFLVGPMGSRAMPGALVAHSGCSACWQGPHSLSLHYPQNLTAVHPSQEHRPPRTTVLFCDKRTTLGCLFVSSSRDRLDTPKRYLLSAEMSERGSEEEGALHTWAPWQNESHMEQEKLCQPSLAPSSPPTAQQAESRPAPAWESETGAGDPLATCNPTHSLHPPRLGHVTTEHSRGGSFTHPLPLKWALGLSPEGNQDLSSPPPNPALTSSSL